MRIAPFLKAAREAKGIAGAAAISTMGSTGMSRVGLGALAHGANGLTSILGGAGGAAGRTAQGAALGGMIGGVGGGIYGAFSDDTSMLGGALMGASIGTGVGAAGGRWGKDIGRIGGPAGKKVYQAAKARGEAAAGYIGNTVSRVVGKIDSTLKANASVSTANAVSTAVAATPVKGAYKSPGLRNTVPRTRSGTFARRMREGSQSQLNETMIRARNDPNTMGTKAWLQGIGDSTRNMGRKGPSSASRISNAAAARLSNRAGIPAGS
jgi:hypothetical protein